MKVQEILTPALILEKSVFERNIALMNEVTGKTGIPLRPHYKSHKSVQIAALQMQNGAKGITCAKLGEAEDLVNAGFKDILLANQVTQKKKIERLAQLCRKSRVTVCADNAENIADLSAGAQRAGTVIPVFIEFNIGQNRCGVDTYEEFYALAKLAAESEGLEFAGIEAYAGHLAHEYDYDKRLKASETIEDTLKGLKAYLEERGLTVKDISGVSTGTLRFREGFKSVYTETQPGSYIFMDSAYTPVNIGFENALFLLASVISVKDNLVVTDGGLKTLSTDMGTPVLKGGEDAEGQMSEEHVSHIIESHRYKVNDFVRYIPSHCCTTVNLHDKIYLVDGDDVVDTIIVTSRGKSY